MSKPWTDTENGALVALYFVMLALAESGKPYSKAAMIRAAQTGHGGSESYAGKLIDRSKGSIEFKLMNASAAHLDCLPDATTMHGFGYRELSNYQAALKEAMAVRLLTRSHTGYVDLSGMYCNHGQAFDTAVAALALT
jgi:hypothetical protein